MITELLNEVLYAVDTPDFSFSSDYLFYNMQIVFGLWFQQIQDIEFIKSKPESFFYDRIHN